MIPAKFDYLRPGNLDETLALLVDLRDVTGLDGIVETDDYLRIGARATQSSSD
jgi:CO/xanthine dehydrogenase FAD-binding subunit